MYGSHPPRGAPAVCAAISHRRADDAILPHTGLVIDSHLRYSHTRNTSHTQPRRQFGQRGGGPSRFPRRPMSARPTTIQGPPSGSNPAPTTLALGAVAHRPPAALHPAHVRHERTDPAHRDASDTSVRRGLSWQPRACGRFRTSVTCPLCRVSTLLRPSMPPKVGQRAAAWAPTSHCGGPMKLSVYMLRPGLPLDEEC